MGSTKLAVLRRLSSLLASYTKKKMSQEGAYKPPDVWKWEQKSGGKFANINRPIAGPTHDKKLPLGEHGLQLYSLGTPNGVKVTIMLEELLAMGKTAEYDAWIINIGEGDQFSSGFVDINPNSKIPALLDRRAGANNQRVFESGSILLYLSGAASGTSTPMHQRDGSTRSTGSPWRPRGSLTCSTGGSRTTGSSPATSTPSPTLPSGHGTEYSSKGSFTRPASSSRCTSTRTW